MGPEDAIVAAAMVAIVLAIVLSWREHPTIAEVRRRLKRMGLGDLKLRAGVSSFVTNKNLITLKVSDGRKAIDKDVVTYMALHEVAHVLSKERTHGKEFKGNFSRLLRLARKEGVPFRRPWPSAP